MLALQQPKLSIYIFCAGVEQKPGSLKAYSNVYREKPTANRGVASRDLPLLLLVFTKGSLLTFKGGQSKKKQKKTKKKV